jgi:hypothetical protein
VIPPDYYTAVVLDAEEITSVRSGELGKKRLFAVMSDQVLMYPSDTRQPAL